MTGTVTWKQQEIIRNSLPLFDFYLVDKHQVVQVAAFLKVCSP